MEIREKVETVVGIKTKLNLGEKLNCSETHVLLEELKGNKNESNN